MYTNIYTYFTTLQSRPFCEGCSKNIYVTPNSKIIKTCFEDYT